MSLPSSTFYPVVIVGGGLAGKSLAVALSRLPFFERQKICLIDAQPEPVAPSLSGWSNRVSMLAPSSIAFLESILSFGHAKTSPSLSSSTRGFGHKWGWPVLDMKVLDSDVPSGTLISSFLGNFFRANLQFTAFSRKRPIGVLIENRALEAVLDEALLSPFGASRVEWLRSCSLDSLLHLDRSPSEQWKAPTRSLLVSSKDSASPKLTISTNLLVACDGANSKIRSLLEMPYTTYDYEQHGIVGTVHVDGGANANPFTAFQRFLSIGPVALLPLSADTYSFVWSVPKALSSLLVKEINDELFVKALNLALTSDLADLLIFLKNPADFIDLPFSTDSRFDVPVVRQLEPGSRASFPLRLGCASRSIAPQTVLIGDAAHTVHPLAGQGLNMGLADVEALRNAISEGMFLGNPAGDFEILEGYSRKRDKANMAMVVAMDVLFKSFVTRASHRIPTSYCSLDQLLNSLVKYGTEPSLFESARRFTINNVASLNSFQRLFQRIAS